MPSYLESPSIRGIEENSSPDFLEPVYLLQNFPGKVKVIRSGSILYHYTRSIEDLLQAQRFDPSRASNPDQAFYFTDLPVKHWTNCQVTVSRNLIMFSYEDLFPEELKRLEQAGNGNFWTGGVNLGFDGRTYRNPDAFAKIDEGVFATEVVIFKSGLPKLGAISSYP